MVGNGDVRKHFYSDNVNIVSAFFKTLSRILFRLLVLNLYNIFPKTSSAEHNVYKLT